MPNSHAAGRDTVRPVGVGVGGGKKSEENEAALSRVRQMALFCLMLCQG